MADEKTYFGIWFSGEVDGEHEGWCCFGSNCGSAIDCFDTEADARAAFGRWCLEDADYVVLELPSHADCVVLRKLVAAVRESLDLGEADDALASSGRPS